ncbi:MAG: hypothetical protein NVV57_12910 [Demequina sp.]|jgi:hypothetical protein|nr:hypothetical protein [Demequina sp.]
MTASSARGLASVLLLALAMIASGCSAQQPLPAPSEGAFAQLVDSFVGGSTGQGLSEQQFATLKSAREAGELTFEQYSAAIDASLECISDAGFHVERYPTDDSGGYPIVTYFYESPETGNPVADECIRRNSEAIEAIYQLQPSSVAAKNAHLEVQAGEIARCLEKEGTEVDFEGLTGDDLAEAVHQAVNDQLAAAAANGTNAQMDCFVTLSQ